MLDVTGDPLVSFVVLSYNYEEHIRTALRSILDQTFADFEVVVVDDRSRDGSLDSIRSFDDPRIRLIQNERNLGGSASFNRGVAAARGRWIVNLDADDWIEPDKIEIQLGAVQEDPSLDIVATWVRFVDETGDRHPRATELEEIVNREHPLNTVGAWIGTNLVCRSSTMVRRSLYTEIGGSDPDMVRAPDYELWTRALAHGYRFGTIAKHLTNYRLHTRGVTHGDPYGTLVEMAYAMIRNLAPLAERRRLLEDWALMARWMVRQYGDLTIPMGTDIRLQGMLIALPQFSTYRAFRDVLESPDPYLERLGSHAIATSASSPADEMEKLNSDIEAYIEARDYWHGEALAWEAQYRELAGPPVE